jgi:hypothetical protein
MEFYLERNGCELFEEVVNDVEFKAAFPESELEVSILKFVII